MIVLLGCHLIAALLAPSASRALGRRVFLAVGAAPAATVAWAVWHGSAVLSGANVVETLPWAPDLGFELVVRVDAFALLMIALVSGIGVLVFAYSRWYFADRADIGRLAGWLVAFAGAMLGLVVADNLLALYLFWELTSISSYLLIGFEDRSAAARASALRALMITAAGGLAMLGGFVLLGERAGTYQLSRLLADPPSGGATEIALLLVLFGAFTKSAQAPFHFWLPGAMAAPTPISAYLHSATMVKAGVYLVARLAPAFAGIWFWRPLVIGVGLATMLIGGWRALRQRDLKLLLAHGTVSQLGLLVVLLGAGYEGATLAGAALLLAHGAFKGALFMVVGIVDHAAGTRDLARLSGWYAPLRATFWVAVIAAASMAGLPPLAGFVAKEAAFTAFLDLPGFSWSPLVLAIVAAGSALTFAYSARFIWGAFAPKASRDLVAEEVVGEVSQPAAAFLAPAAVLAMASILAGAAPGLVSRLVVEGARALDPRVPPQPLVLWHGFTAALALSLAAIATGLLMWHRRDVIVAFQRRVRLPLDGAYVHDVAVASLLRGAGRITGRLQTGSLPMYLVVIIGSAVVFPGAFLLADGLPGEVLLVDRPMQLPVALLMIVATAIAVRAVRRITAVLSSSIVGYGIAFLFVIQGAPDLALTQLLVETLLLVVFVLVLRHLPPTFEARGAAWQVTRIVAACAVGLFTATVALVAAAARVETSISSEYLRRALPEGHGRNVVNVILVDFRAFDTFGEILVLTVAALGVIGLIRAVRRERRQDGVSHRVHEGYRPSVILNGATQILFGTLLMVSFVLLLVGHDRPGGGFIGGLVAGAAFVLVYLAGGTPRVRRAEPAFPELYLGSGITLAAVTGAVAWLRDGEFLEAFELSVTAPLVGHIGVSSVFLFDVGVYLVVVGLITALLESIGHEETVAS